MPSYLLAMLGSLSLFHWKMLSYSICNSAIIYLFLPSLAQGDKMIKIFHESKKYAPFLLKGFLFPDQHENEIMPPKFHFKVLQSSPQEDLLIFETKGEFLWRWLTVVLLFSRHIPISFTVALQVGTQEPTQDLSNCYVHHGF